MQLNSLYTTHDMRLSNILQQYDYTFSYGLKLFTIWHTVYSGDSGIVSEISHFVLKMPLNTNRPTNLQFFVSIPTGWSKIKYPNTKISISQNYM